ncbi:uncharacterized protein LOC141855894 [Brevipalpus obovatus]|uniref:uncharacterized protein LOC141855894 n=1 Tax=Brevipalpus obovatus TaxID=246614 RepID=UPI003D9DFFB6
MSTKVSGSSIFSKMFNKFAWCLIVLIIIQQCYLFESSPAVQKFFPNTRYGRRSVTLSPSEVIEDMEERLLSAESVENLSKEPSTECYYAALRYLIRCKGKEKSSLE